MFVKNYLWLSGAGGEEGVLATRYSQGPWTDFDAKYAKTRGSAQGCAFSGSRT